jgi:Sulfotransferase domain
LSNLFLNLVLLYLIPHNARIVLLDPQLRLSHEIDQQLTIFKGKRVFIKDIIHYLVPPEGKPATIAPSLQRIKRGVGTSINGSAECNGTKETKGITTNGTASKAPYPFATEAEPDNPTVVPADMLAKFHFTFLIRDPHSSIPSYFRCTVPPLDEITGFNEFYSSEAGYDEVRRVFDYLRKIGHVGPRLTGKIAGSSKGEPNGVKPDGVEICVLDADDLLDNPAGIIEAYCKSVGLNYDPEMLSWDSEEQHTNAKVTFEKWKGFHEDAIHSKELKPRTHVSQTPTWPSFYKRGLPGRMKVTSTNHYRRNKTKPSLNGTKSGRKSMVQKGRR